ncbi:MAG: glycosyltransferase family 2 protein [Magnetococcales bacterium]|nr:glycosyltransferase family 2 protein [Magnetococcales bacterium]
MLPVYNEANNLVQLYDSLHTLLSSLGMSYELLFIDDGSDDRSYEVILSLHERDPLHVRGFQLRTNFGKGAAYSTGFSKARGDIIVTMDADNQDDPADLPLFLERIRKGADVVVGWKQDGKNTRVRSHASKLFNWTVSKLTGVRLHDVNCPFKAFRREVLEEVEIYGDLFRFLPVIAVSRGFSVTEIPVQNRPRLHGSSKFGISRYHRGLLDLMTVLMLTRFARRPLHFIGVNGILAGGIGFAILLFLTIAHLLFELGVLTSESWDIHERPLLTLGVLLIIVGLQFFSIGLLGELIIARHGTRQDQSEYPIRQSTPDV